MNSKLPTKLHSIRNQVIEHVRNSAPLPENLSDLISWYEGDGWDELVPTWEPEEHIALNLNYVSWLKFSDSELIANQENDEPVTDELRIKYARKLIFETFENYDGYECPSVQAVEISKANGDSAVLGWLIEIHGQGGPVAIYQGAYTDKKQFYENLRECNFLLDTEQHNLTVEEILKLWAKPPKPIRSIAIEVSWGNEQHKCPMADATWRRIVKGKLVRRVEHYRYEGKRYKSEWLFNSQSFGSLVVNYDDGGVGFDGKLSDALIWTEDQQSSWMLELVKYGSSANLLSALTERSTHQDKSPPPYDFWIVADSFVCEPCIGGQFIGEKVTVNLNRKRLLSISQKECDALMDAVYREEGTYPDS
jgi:hypothetical protein